MTRKLSKYLDVLHCLGPAWLAYRTYHAFCQRSGWIRRRQPCVPWAGVPSEAFAEHCFFPASQRTSQRAIREASTILRGELRYFFRHTVRAGFPPDWLANPSCASGQRQSLSHWSEVPDFGGGDIKAVWEPNRFGFVYWLARAYAGTHDTRFAEAFWQAVEDWREKNPPQCGPNWKCGQEIALRLMAWLFGYHVFSNAPCTRAERRSLLAEMIDVSARRIERNIGYALSQKNNHGVSEATGLFTAGIALGNQRWVERGRALLEQLARQLIYDDGSFSQHSTNYHRLMLHDYLWAIQLGRCNGIHFSGEALARIRRAGEWLLALMDRNTGRVPNLGANDGALVLPLADCDYLDFRPTVQAVGAIIDGNAWLPAGAWDELPMWLGATWAETVPADVPETCQFFPHGGYAVLSDHGTMGVFRCPRRFRHRPVHCDLLHFDLWHRGTNVLRDSGTYSYHCEEPWQDYFSATAAHNTIQFDDHDQMPKLSRFLFGRWPTATIENRIDGERPSVTAGFTDWRGCRHYRTVAIMPGGYRITDRIRGYKEKAVLRWRLAPEWKWELRGDECRSERCVIRVTTQPGPVVRELATGWESLYYFEKTELPVLQTSVGSGPQEFTTEIRFPS